MDNGGALHDPGGLGYVIHTVYAYVVVHDSGDEAIPALTLPGPDGGVVMMPLIGADLERMTNLRRYALEVSKASGKPIKLARFTQREDMETIGGPA